MRIEAKTWLDADDVSAGVGLLDLVAGRTELRRESAGSWCGPCPKCGGDDRFVVRPHGNAAGAPPGWWCRKCHPKAAGPVGFVMWIESAGFEEAVEWLAQQSGRLPAAGELAVTRRLLAESEKRERRHRAAAVAHLAASYRERDLQAALRRRADVVESLVAGGMCEYAVDRFGFGLASWRGRPALTIPWRIGGRLEALQYRLLDASDGDRYRWAPGTSGTLWNGDAALEPEDDYVVICEGAKKAAVVWSAGLFGVCAVPNKTSAQRIVAEHAEALAKIGRVYVLLDPDAQAEAGAAAAGVPGARVLSLPAKVDDWLVERGCDGEALARRLRSARRVE